ncbi:MAG: exonuclease domain-containing protein [bacterium]|nr:exonuclease domain-containing protein [bacterium]
MEFVALDFETANRERGSICAIGYALVSHGSLVDSGSWLVQLPKRYDYFDDWNRRIHGLGPEDLLGAATFAESATRLIELIADRPVVVHNASFDIYAFRDAATEAHVAHSGLVYADTLVMSRRELALISYRLPIVCEALGVSLPQHHRAEDDAVACAGVLLALARRRSVSSLDALADALHVRLGYLTGDGGPGASCFARPVGGLYAVAPDANPNADPEHQLFGQVMVFTGALSLTRADAWDWVASVGATPDENVTKRTTILVIGDGFRGDTAEEFRSGKARKAVALLEKGQRIEVMSEEQLMDLLADSPSPAREDPQ